MMKTLMGLCALAGVAGLLDPPPADAQGTDAEHDFVRCTNAVIQQCDALFPGSGPFSTAARGWCYLAGTAQCLGEPETLES